VPNADLIDVASEMHLAVGDGDPVKALTDGEYQPDPTAASPPTLAAAVRMLLVEGATAIAAKERLMGCTCAL